LLTRRSACFRFSQRTFAEGAAEVFNAPQVYDSNGYPASKTEWNGNKTTYVNDAHG
jgi:hypothetical protein